MIVNFLIFHDCVNIHYRVLYIYAQNRKFNQRVQIVLYYLHFVLSDYTNSVLHIINNLFLIYESEKVQI